MWDYPRPPRMERSTRLAQVYLGEELIAESRSSIRVLETSHPPVWYLPSTDVRPGVLTRSSAGQTLCEWKGAATYWDVRTVRAAAWSYENPTPGFEDLVDHIAFMPIDLACHVDGTRVLAQDGGFYGGWITPDVVGPFKGAPGSWGW